MADQISKRYLAMGALTGLLHHMDWLSMLLFVMSGVACLICLTVHELTIQSTHFGTTISANCTSV